MDETDKIIKEPRDLSYLKWSLVRSSSGTAGSFLKSESGLDGVKTYYKLSRFDATRGITGHECVNEIIVDRLLSVLGIEHLDYKLINADIEIEGLHYNTWVCASIDFKKRGEGKIALDDFYRNNALPGESHYDFCVRSGWKKIIDQMIAVDFIILNRDRHGANIEVLRNNANRSYRIAPLFDHGLSLIYSCESEAEASAYDIMDDKRCNNFIGGYSCLDNLSLIDDRSKVFDHRLKESDRDYIFDGLDNILPEIFRDKIWQMIYKRYRIYEDL